MIAHLVLFAPRPDLTRQDEDGLALALERAAREIPTVRAARVGRRVRHGAGYEAPASADFPYFVLLEFDDLAGLRAYLDHPGHLDLAARFYQTLREARVFDYDIGDVSLIRGWLEDRGRGPEV